MAGRGDAAIGGSVGFGSGMPVLGFGGAGVTVRGVTTGVEDGAGVMPRWKATEGEG
jgi:hypothetical protein